MSDEQLERLLKCLDGLRRKPGMYLGNVDPIRADCFLSGFSAAIDVLCGIERKWELDKETIEKRGWKVRATGSLIHQMTARGMSPDEIIAELVLIEIDLIKGRHSLSKENE